MIARDAYSNNSPHAANAVDADAVLAALSGVSLSDLCKHDRGMVRGRALARLRDKYRDEYEHNCQIEAYLLIASGQARTW